MSYLATRASFLQPYKGKSPEQSRFAAGLATRLLCIPVNFQVQVQFFSLCCQAKWTSSSPRTTTEPLERVMGSERSVFRSRQQPAGRQSGSVMHTKVTKSCSIWPPPDFQSKRKACPWGLRWRGKYRYRSKSQGLVWFIWQSRQSILSVLGVMTFLFSVWLILGFPSLYSMWDWCFLIVFSCAWSTWAGRKCGNYRNYSLCWGKVPRILLNLTPLFCAAPTGTFSALLWMDQGILTHIQAMVIKPA